MSTQRQSTVWVDAQGKTTARLTTTSAGAVAVVAAIAALSNAAVQETWEGPLTAVAAPTPTAADKISVRDSAELVYSTAAGSLVKVSIPAPQAAIFMADGETVNPAAVAALTALVLANVVTPAGVAVTAYVAGTRAHT
jgi:biotin carboxyl carrier protein